MMIKVDAGRPVCLPAQTVSGATNFNAHLFSAELLLMDDVGGSSDYHTQLRFGDGIKQLIDGKAVQCHAKGRLNLLKPLWSLLITLNDGLENLQVLPPLNRDIVDKLIILKALSSRA